MRRSGIAQTWAAAASLWSPESVERLFTFLVSTALVKDHDSRSQEVRSYLLCHTLPSPSHFLSFFFSSSSADLVHQGFKHRPLVLIVKPSTYLQAVMVAGAALIDEIAKSSGSCDGVLQVRV